MAERTYTAWNGSMQGGSVTKVTTGTALKTMMQLATNPVGPPIRIIEWGCSFDGTSLATPGVVELVSTGQVGATVTAYNEPYTTVHTAIASGATTTLVVTNGSGGSGTAGFPSSAPFTIRVFPQGPPTAAERMLVTTAATGTNASWTVVRNIDGNGALSAIAAGSPVIGELGQFFSDVSANNNGVYIPPSSVLLNGSTTGSGFTSSAEGTITTVRQLAGPKLIQPTNLYEAQYPLAREPEVAPGDVVRIRMTFGAAINALCYIIWAE